jgi:flagellar protein FliS
MLQKTPYGASAYRAIGIETGVAAADPLGLVVMLYDGAIQAIARAEGHHAAGEIEHRGTYTSKAIDIIQLGLAASLDQKVGGALAESLAALYDYMGRRLFTANLTGDRAVYEEVRVLLGELRASWVTLRLTTGQANPLQSAAHAVEPVKRNNEMIHAFGRSLHA